MPNETQSEMPAIDYSAIAKEAVAVEKNADQQLQQQGEQAPKVNDVGEPVVEQPKTEAAKPVEVVAEEPAFVKKGFEQLVKKQAEFRETTEKSKHGIELAQVLDAPKAAALKAALEKKDVLGTLSALGISYTDVAHAISGVKGKPPEKTPEKPAERPQTDPEIESMKATFRAAQQQQLKNNIESAAKKVIAEQAAKLPYVSGMEATDEVLAVLDELWARGGNSFPSNDPMENLRIAAEEAEIRLARQYSRFEKVKKPLTKVAESVSVPTSQATETPVSPAHGSGGTTLTNKLSAPAQSVPDEFNIESVYAELGKDPNMRK